MFSMKSMFPFYFIVFSMFLYYSFMLGYSLYMTTISLLFVVTNSIYSISPVCYIIMFIFYLSYTIIIMFFMYLPMKFFIIPMLRNECHMVLSMQLPQSIMLFYFYMLGSLLILSCFSSFFMAFVEWLYYMIQSNYYYSLYFNTLEFNFLIESENFMLPNVCFMDNMPEEESLHPRTCRDPSKGHLPLGSLVEHAHINYDMLNKKILTKTLKGKIIPEHTLTYVNLTDWSISEIFNQLSFWGYDTSYIYFKTIENQKIDYGMLYDIPVKSRNGIESPSVPYLSVNPPSSSMLSSYIISDPSSSLPVLNSSSLANSLNNFSKLNPLSSSFSTNSSNDVMKPFLKSSSNLSLPNNNSSTMSTCSVCSGSLSGASAFPCNCSSSINSSQSNFPTTSYLYTIEESMECSSSSSSSNNSIICICSTCSNPLESCSCNKNFSPSSDDLSDLCLLSPETMKDLDALCSPHDFNHLSVTPKDLSSPYLTQHSSYTSINPSITDNSTELQKPDSTIENSDPLNLFNYSIDDSF